MSNQQLAQVSDTSLITRLLLGASIMGSVVMADPVTEIAKQVQSLNNRPSMDPTPVTFSIEEVTFRAPRNFIVWLSNWEGTRQELVRFRVTFPGFEPLTDKTAGCISVPPAYRPPGCGAVEFMIRAGSSDATDERALSNSRTLFRSQTPKQGPFGFELYETGNPDVQTETYVKRAGGKILVIACFVGAVTTKSQTPICSRNSRLDDGVVLQYHLFKSELKDAETLDLGFRKLIETFKANGRSQA
jgi:hypothetical protein